MSNQLVVRNRNTQTTRRRVQPMFNPNQLMYDLGFGAVEGAGKLAVQAVRGIVSAFRSKGATREEVKTLVAPLARTMQYGARQPRYLRADGGLMIEHIEAMSVNSNVNSYVVDTNLFPWLRNIANNFEEYQIQLMFAWNPTCPATTTGQVWMAYDYDPEDSDTSYLQVQDYFNTADHCISAIWAPAVINPKQSGWLKTGNNGTPRLYSPGKLYLSTTDTAQGFLTVKYRIHLRKPQPSFPASDAFFSGSLTNPITPFASRSAVYGDASLIANRTSTQFTVLPSSGTKIVVFYFNGTVPGIATTSTNATQLGVRSSGGITAVTMSVAAGQSSDVGITGTAGPITAIPYRATVYRVGTTMLE